MNLLVDKCVSQFAVLALREHGHHANWVGEWSEDPGDVAILETALRDKCVLITADKDFGELVFLQGLPHPGLVRLPQVRPSAQASLLLNLLDRHQADLEKGALITIQGAKIRVRRFG